MDPQASAFGYAQRRSWVFSSWWYGAVLAISGAVHTGLAAAVGESMEVGIGLVILGGVFAAVGWVLSAWPRFSRKPARPASDVSRVEQGIRITPGMIGTILVANGLGVTALVAFTPDGGLLQVLPLLGMLLALALGTAAGLAYTGHIMKNAARLHASWLERR